jgi:hypothetical protein
VINTQDQAFASLRIWKDANADGLTNTGELLTLEQAGVANLNVGYSDGSEGDAHGNQHRQLGGYTTTTGTTQKMNDVWFTTDTARTQDREETITINATIAALPNIEGMGNVRSLQQAMARDTSGELQTLVQQWKTGTGVEREAMLDNLIYHWAGVQGVDPESRGPNIGDARSLATLEQMLGQTYFQYGGGAYGPTINDPGESASANLRITYDTLKADVRNQLFWQTDAPALLGQLRLQWNASTEQFTWDASQLAHTLNEQFNQSSDGLVNVLFSLEVDDVLQAA